MNKPHTHIIIDTSPSFTGPIVGSFARDLDDAADLASLSKKSVSVFTMDRNISFSSRNSRTEIESLVELIRERVARPGPGTNFTESIENIQHKTIQNLVIIGDGDLVPYTEVFELLIEKMKKNPEMHLTFIQHRTRPASEETLFERAQNDIEKELGPNRVTIETGHTYDILTKIVNSDDLPQQGKTALDTEFLVAARAVESASKDVDRANERLQKAVSDLQSVTRKKGPQLP